MERVGGRDLERDLDLARALAQAAGAAILPHFRKSVAIENKRTDGLLDPVTIADRAAEAAMRRMIASARAQDGIIGEEYGAERQDAEHVWVLDPIDGTRGFVMGLPVWGVLIGLLHRGRPVLGVMHQPFVGETFLGSRAGARVIRDGRSVPLRVRACAGIEDAALATTAPELFSAQEAPAFEALRQRARLVRYGTDCYAYALLAGGHIDLVVEAGLQLYDIAALVPIVEGAGGRITDWRGEPPGSGRIVASGDARLHDAALARLSAAP